MRKRLEVGEIDVGELQGLADDLAERIRNPTQTTEDQGAGLRQRLFEVNGRWPTDAELRNVRQAPPLGMNRRSPPPAPLGSPCRGRGAQRSALWPAQRARRDSQRDQRDQHRRPSPPQWTGQTGHLWTPQIRPFPASRDGS